VYLSLHGSEDAQPTRHECFAQHLPDLAIHALQTLDGPHTDSREFVDVRVTEALKGHRESHFLELVRNEPADHGCEGRHRCVFSLKKATNTLQCVITLTL
jgi:hypothetical protein